MQQFARQRMQSSDHVLLFTWMRTKWNAVGSFTQCSGVFVRQDQRSQDVMNVTNRIDVMRVPQLWCPPASAGPGLLGCPSRRIKGIRASSDLQMIVDVAGCGERGKPCESRYPHHERCDALEACHIPGFLQSGTAAGDSAECGWQMKPFRPSTYGGIRYAGSALHGLDTGSAHQDQRLQDVVSTANRINHGTRHANDAAPLMLIASYEFQAYLRALDRPPPLRSRGGLRRGAFDLAFHFTPT
jgi:hypothetical protein